MVMVAQVDAGATKSVLVLARPLVAALGDDYNDAQALRCTEGAHAGRHGL